MHHYHNNKINNNQMRGAIPLPVLIALSVIVSIVLVGYFWYFVSPQLRTVQSLIVQAQGEVDDLNNKLTQLDKSKDIMSEIAPLVGKLALTLPSDQNAPELLLLMTELAAQSDVAELGELVIGEADEATDSTNAAGSSETDDYKEIPISFSVSGEYQSIIKLLNNLYKSIRPIEVKSFVLTPASESTEEGEGVVETNPNLIQASFEATAYYIPEKSLEVSPDASGQTETVQ